MGPITKKKEEEGKVVWGGSNHSLIGTLLFNSESPISAGKKFPIPEERRKHN